MHDHNHNNKDHKHDGCCDHDHGHHHVHGHESGHSHGTSNDHHHEHSHHHTHAHDNHHKHHDHDHGHHHDHDCCGHDHGHAHKHLSAHECTALFNKAQTTQDSHEAMALLIEAGCGFAHLGDAAATKAVNGLLAEKTKVVAPLSNLQNAQVQALRALELGLAQAAAAKDALSKSVDELENFSGAERSEVEQLLGDVRKSLAGIRATGLKSLLNKLKF